MSYMLVDTEDGPVGLFVDINEDDPIVETMENPPTTSCPVDVMCLLQTWKSILERNKPIVLDDDIPY